MPRCSKLRVHLASSVHHRHVWKTIAQPPLLPSDGLVPARCWSVALVLEVIRFMNLQAGFAYYIEDQTTRTGIVAL